MEEAGWIRAQWRTTENHRRARVYELTRAGRKQLETDERRWTSVTAAIAQVLKTRRTLQSLDLESRPFTLQRGDEALKAAHWPKIVEEWIYFE